MNELKKFAKLFINQIINTLNQTKIGRYFFDTALHKLMDSHKTIKHNNIKLIFSTPTRLNHWRTDTFSSKEPETLEWIDNIQENSTLWDIGANIGLYSCYAAAQKKCTVFAFEPSVFNLELLARNIFLNKLNHKISIIPLPLSDTLSISTMRLTSTDWGGSLSTFDKDFGWDGKAIKQIFDFRTLGLSMDDTIELLKIPSPDYIKMDVDGLEHFILKGGSEVLKQIKGILIEVNDDFHDQASKCHDLLTDAGLTLKEKRHSDIIANPTSGFSNTYNQIWIRP